ncbi:MAG: electron transporter [Bacteroidia bacterium]|nr:MAG: electron transporter [Bacteroidia bacterium]
MKSSLLLLIVCFGIVGCRKEQPSTDLVTFNVRGVVVSVNMEKRRVVMDHEEIPNYMKAMTMPFRVKDTTLLLKIQPGDTVEGILAVSRTESWLESLSVVGSGEEPASPSSAADQIFRRIYKVGDPLPDFTFVNQDRKTVKLSDFRGKTVAITFIYSRCPLPDFCIQMSSYFSRVQRNLKKDSRLDGKWHLLTVSFDPDFDKPEVLKKYGTAYDADFSTWDFVTGDLGTIRDFADGLELVVEDDEGGLLAHNLRTAVIDAGGVLREVYKGNEWTVQELEDAIRRASRKSS